MGSENLAQLLLDILPVVGQNPRQSLPGVLQTITASAYNQIPLNILYLQYAPLCVHLSEGGCGKLGVKSLAVLGTRKF